MNRDIAKPQVLVASPTPVFPANDGGRIYFERHLKALQGEVDYHLLAMVNPQERAGWDGAAHEEFFSTVTVVDRPPLMPDLDGAQAWRHFWFHVRNGLPLISMSYYSHEAVEAARTIIAAHGIELLEVLNTQMTFLRRFITNIPSILICPNIEGDLHPFWAGERSIPERAMWKALGALSRRSTRRVELGNRLGFTNRFYISRLDAARADEPNGVLPMVTPIEYPARLFSATRLDLLTIGTFDWPPNAEGVRWLLDEVWPLVTTPHSRLDIIGANPPADVVARETDRIRVHGFVEDAAAWRHQADVLLVPILSGSGVRVKIVEALGVGLPVITTTKGGEGVDLSDGRTAIIANDPAAFAAAIDGLGSSVQRRRQLSGLGHRLAEEQHSPAAAAAIKRSAYESALGRPLGSA